MGRSPCCEKDSLKKGPWTAEEDQKLLAYIEEHGHGSWRALPTKAGLQRCGKSCRLRWTNYLRPDIIRGKFSLQEEQTIIQLHALLGNRWSAIASHLSKRTDNEIKNYWNTHLKKRLTKMGIDPVTHKPKTDTLSTSKTKNAANLCHMAQWESARLEAEARLVRESKFHRSVVLRAWQPQPNTTPIDLESPTSTLTFSETNSVQLGEEVEWKCFGRPMRGLNVFEPTLMFGEDGLTHMLIHNSGDNNSSSDGCSGDRGGREEENKSYWNSILNLVNAGSSPSLF